MSRSLSRDQSTRQAVLSLFCDPRPQDLSRLQNLSEREWRKLLTWLDIGGLTLYFLNRIAELKANDVLPLPVLARLQQNQSDNNLRTNGFATESVAIQREFQEEALCYAVLKGFSLWPSSFSKPELRHQFDLDFLVAEKNASKAREILESHGYRLYAISGKTWEFKKNETPGVPIRDLYKDLPGRSVELHLEGNTPNHPRLLDRIEHRHFYGISMPVLSAVDLFLNQGLHVYKHLNSEFSRVGHLLEFRQHVLTRRHDDVFWQQLRSAIGDEHGTCMRLGLVTLLIAHVMDDFAPEAFVDFTVCRLSPAAMRWVEWYGDRAVYQNFPGSKLYLLLQSELDPMGAPGGRSLRQALFPSHLPPTLVRAANDESLAIRLRRYRMQIRFVISRLRFHIVEGLRYARESYRWRQAKWIGK